MTTIARTLIAALTISMITRSLRIASITWSDARDRPGR